MWHPDRGISNLLNNTSSSLFFPSVSVCVCWGGKVVGGPGEGRRMACPSSVCVCVCGVGGSESVVTCPTSVWGKEWGSPWWHVQTQYGRLVGVSSRRFPGGLPGSATVKSKQYTSDVTTNKHDHIELWFNLKMSPATDCFSFFQSHLIEHLKSQTLQPS